MLVVGHADTFRRRFGASLINHGQPAVCAHAKHQHRIGSPRVSMNISNTRGASVPGDTTTASAEQ